MKIWVLRIHEDGTDFDCDTTHVGRTPLEAMERWKEEMLPLFEDEDEGAAAAFLDAWYAILNQIHKTNGAAFADGYEDIWFFQLQKHEIGE